MPDLLEQISALIDASDPDRERIERTLTDGYARALALEAERWRLEKRLAEVAHRVAAGDPVVTTQELARISACLTGNEDELAVLRRRLGALRRHAGGG